MKNNSPAKCVRKTRRRIHRKAARGLRIRNNTIKIRCHPHSFKVTKSIKNILKNIKGTINNVNKSQPASRNRISIDSRITNGTLNNFYVLRFTDQFLKHRLIKMANNSLNSNTLLQNITITFDKMLELRKKRLSFKSGKTDAKTTLVDNIIEIDDHLESNGIITIVDENNHLGESSGLVTNPDLMENNDVILVEDTKQIKNNEVIIVEDTLEQQNLVIDNKQNGSTERKISSAVESQLAISENLEEQKNLISKSDSLENLTICYDVNENNCDTSDYGSVGQKPTLQNTSMEESLCEVLVENSENTSIFHLITEDEQNDPDVLNVNVERNYLNDVSMPFVLSDDANNDSVIIVSPPKSSTHTSETISTQVDMDNQTRKRKARSSCSSVITVSDVTDLSCDFDSSDVIFVGEQYEPILPTAKRKKTEPESNSTQGLRRSKRQANKLHELNRHFSNLSTKATATSNSSYIPLSPNMHHINNIPTDMLNNYNHINKFATDMLNNYNHINNIPTGMLNNNVDNNICNTGRIRRHGLRKIIIDGSNIALGHSNGTIFSVRGLEIAIDYFLKKGHEVITFVPQYRSKSGQSSNPQLLRSLNRRQLVIFTPSREVNGRRITPYDDRFIIQYANSCEGVVVSNDNFRDILKEKPQWRRTIEKRILMYTWVGDVLMFPEDPLGRNGPNLTRFLRFP